jgi:hypothetical protein
LPPCHQFRAALKKSGSLWACSCSLLGAAASQPYSPATNQDKPLYCSGDDGFKAFFCILGVALGTYLVPTLLMYLI